MIPLFFFLLSVLSVTIQAKSTIDDPDYIAGVVSYTPVTFSNKTTVEKFVKENLKNYLDLIAFTNGKNVDILVFPEATLNYWGLDNNRTLLLEGAIVIPDIDSVNATPAKDPEQGEVLQTISRKAAEHQMYILLNVIEVSKCMQTHISEEVQLQSTESNDTDLPHAESVVAEKEVTQETVKESDLCGEDGFMLFNTNVVFNRNGTIISKYRKHNLYNEPAVTIEEKPEVASFTTDFGIQFGHFISFDILFKKPAMKLVQNNIRHILFPTLWFSEIPFLTAAQVQAAWANANNVVLLASGGNVAEWSSSGTGIYIGRHGASRLLMSPNDEKRVIIDKVPKNPDITELEGSNDVKEFSPLEMQNFHVNIFDVKGIHILESPKTEHVCEDFLCCSYEITYRDTQTSSSKKFYTYKAASGINERTPSPNVPLKEAYCAILACTDEREPKSCGHRFPNYKDVDRERFVFESIKIEAKFDMSNNMSFLASPNTLDTSLLPLKGKLFDFKIHSIDEYDKHYQIYTLQLKHNTTLTDFLTYGIHAIIYTGADSEENGGVKTSISMKVLLIVLLWLGFRAFFQEFLTV